MVEMIIAAGVVIGVLLVIGITVQHMRENRKETPKEMADRMNREFQKRMEYEERTPVFEDGSPNPIYYQVEANRLNYLDRPDQADAILNEGIELCRRAGMDDAVARLQKLLNGTR